MVVTALAPPPNCARAGVSWLVLTAVSVPFGFKELPCTHEGLSIQHCGSTLASPRRARYAPPEAWIPGLGPLPQWPSPFSKQLLWVTVWVTYVCVRATVCVCACAACMRAVVMAVLA